MRARFAATDDAIGEAHAQRLLCADRAAGEDQIDCLRMADQPRQADGAEIDQGHAKTAAENAEGRVVCDHAHIRPQRQLHPAGHRKTLDRRDHGL